MRMALEGRISLSLRPPGYNPDQWAQHPDIEIVEDLLAIHKLDTRPVLLIGHIHMFLWRFSVTYVLLFMVCNISLNGSVLVL